MSAIEITAHDAETAIKTGLAQLTLLRAEVRIEVLDEGSKGVLGIGARLARVRLTPYAELESNAAPAATAAQAQPASTTPTPDRSTDRTVAPPTSAMSAQATPVEAEDMAEEQVDETWTEGAPAETAITSADSKRSLSPEAEQLAATLTQGVLDRMEFDVTCTSRIVQGQGREESASVWVDIQGNDASRLLAHQCEALDALQLVVQTMWAHQTKSGLRVTLDADSYKERREKRIQQMAQRLAERVISSGRAITLEPMSPSERRLVHIALREHPQVTTESHGEGSGRRVTIKLK
jgi:spoIIIJ-associated protein